MIRKATSGDREAVLRIHDHVYDGHDYLPAYYDHFLSSSDFIPFVMIYDGKIVSTSRVIVNMRPSNKSDSEKTTCCQ